MIGAPGEERGEGGDLTELDGRPEGHRWEQTSGGCSHDDLVSELWAGDREEEAEGGEHGDSQEVRI